MVNAKNAILVMRILTWFGSVIFNRKWCSSDCVLPTAFMGICLGGSCAGGAYSAPHIRGSGGECSLRTPSVSGGACVYPAARNKVNL